MTDVTAVKKGIGKTGAASVVLEIAQHIQPLLATYLHQKFFFLNDTLCAELSTLIVSLIGAWFVWVTPQNFVDAIVDAIIFLRKSWRKIRNASDGEDDVTGTK